MTWEVVRLGEITSINPRDPKPDTKSDISFVGMAELNASAAATVDEEVRPFGEVSKGYTQFRNGDLLLAKITPCWENGKIGEAKLNHAVGVGSTEFHIVRPSEKLDKRYTLHFLRAPRVRINGELRMTGSGGQRRVPTSYVSDLEIPVPPLEEQRRIAAILDEADEIRTKRRAQLTLLDELPQSLFHEMFGSLASTSVVPLKDVIKWASGKFLPASQQTGGAIPVYGGNGVNGWHDEHMFTEPRIIVGRVGAYCGAVHLTAPHAWVTDNALIATLLQPNLTLQYLSFALAEANLNQYAATSGQPSISAGRISDVEVLLPPLTEQQVFAEKVEAIQAERSRITAALTADDELFAALQYRAFRGEL